MFPPPSFQWRKLSYFLLISKHFAFLSVSSLAGQYHAAIGNFHCGTTILFLLRILSRIPILPFFASRRIPLANRSVFIPPFLYFFGCHKQFHNLFLVGHPIFTIGISLTSTGIPIDVSELCDGQDAVSLAITIVYNHFLLDDSLALATPYSPIDM